MAENRSIERISSQEGEGVPVEHRRVPTFGLYPRYGGATL
jgi:hypothetical protein